MAQSRRLFTALLENPQGIIVGRMKSTANFREIRHADGKINLCISEMAEWMQELTPDKEEQATSPDPQFPMILQAGRHTPENANTLMHKPDWNAGVRSMASMSIHSPLQAGATGWRQRHTINMFRRVEKIESAMVLKRQQFQI